MELSRAWNRHNPRLLRQQPGQGNLGARYLPLLRDLAQGVHYLLVRLARFGIEPRKAVAEDVARESRVLIDSAGQEAFAQRAEGNKADTQFLERWQNFLLRLSPPQRILALQSHDRLHRMGARKVCAPASERPKFLTLPA